MTYGKLPEVAIQDANILIDLMNVGLLELVAELPITYLVPDLVVAELKDASQREVLQGAIKKGVVQHRGFDGTEMERIAAIYADESGISMPDCSCLYLAENEDCMLLTGDSALRSIAGRRQVRVHGALWLIDTAINRGLLSKALAADKLLDMLRGRSPCRWGSASHGSPGGAKSPARKRWL